MVRTLSVAAVDRQRPKKVPRNVEKEPTETRPEVHHATPTGDVLSRPTAARQDDFTRLLVAYHEATVADLVGRISRTLAYYTGSDHLAELDMVMAKRLGQVDPYLRRALTIRVIAGAQEASRFGLIVTAAAGGPYPDELGLLEARRQLGRMS